MGVDFGLPHFDLELDELSQLALTAGLKPVAKMTCKRKAPDAALFVGSGKADEIKFMAEQMGAKEVLFDQSLSPAQQRNLERHLGLPVNDRTLLILEIFGQRARSHDGKLQVELARLQYLSTRLVRRWSHLERQRGGIGTRGGPGETQIELDRRMINDAIKRTKDRLSKVKKQRSTQRRQRDRRNSFNVSLVGYTNAGKSTLFNALTKAGSYAADQLFATLDTTSRRIHLGEGMQIVLSDTVGFIRELPHQLVEAFRATLDETVHADLILHVVDACSPVALQQQAEVEAVLKEIGADTIPRIEVMNKIDQMPQTFTKGPQIERDINGLPYKVFISAQEGMGLDLLRQCLTEFAQMTDKLRVEHALVQKLRASGDLLEPLTDRPETADFDFHPNPNHSPNTP